MKNFSLLLNVLLLIAVGILFYLVLGRSGTTKAGGKAVTHDSASSSSTIRIAFFEMDSIQEHTDMVKDVKAEITKKEEAITAELRRRGQEYQDKMSKYGARQQSGQMTQAELEAANADIGRTQESITARKQVLDQEYNELMSEKNLTMRKSIEEFIQEYNKTHNYTYIVSDEPGLFYFKDASFNITQDVIKGLNERYKSKK